MERQVSGRPGLMDRTDSWYNKLTWASKPPPQCRTADSNLTRRRGIADRDATRPSHSIQSPCMHVPNNWAFFTGQDQPKVRRKRGPFVGLGFQAWSGSPGWATATRLILMARRLTPTTTQAAATGRLHLGGKLAKRARRTQKKKKKQEMLPLLQKALGYFSLSIPGCPIRGHVGAVPSPRRAAHHVMMRLLRLAASPPAGSAPTKSCCSSWLACICMPGSAAASP